MKSSGIDRAFLEKLYNQNSRLLYSIVCQYVNTDNERKEILGDVISEIAARASYFTAYDEGKHPLLVGIIAHLTAMGYVYQHYPANALLRELDDPLEEIHAYNYPPAEALIVINIERCATLQAWSSLADDEKTLLGGKYLLGYTEQELAYRVGCSTEEVSQRIARARKRALEEVWRNGIQND